LLIYKLIQQGVDSKSITHEALQANATSIYRLPKDPQESLEELCIMRRISKQGSKYRLTPAGTGLAEEIIRTEMRRDQQQKLELEALKTPEDPVVVPSELELGAMRKDLYTRERILLTLWSLSPNQSEPITFLQLQGEGIGLIEELKKTVSQRMDKLIKVNGEALTLTKAGLARAMDVATHHRLSAQRAALEVVTTETNDSSHATLTQCNEWHHLKDYQRCLLLLHRNYENASDTFTQENALTQINSIGGDEGHFEEMLKAGWIRLYSGDQYSLTNAGVNWALKTVIECRPKD